MDLVWSEIDPGVSEEVEGGTFADSLHGWIVGANGMIARTVDAGASWEAQQSGVAALLDDVFFLDANQGWVVGDGGTILHTIDAGQTWTLQVSGRPNHRLRSVYFRDVMTGWIVGDGGTLLHTANGGQTWTLQASGTAFRLYALTFVDDDTGWVVGDNGTILRSTDGGQTWTRQPSGTTNALLGIDFVDDETGWISGEGGTILRFAGTGGETGTAVDEEPGAGPAAFALAQNYPNPFERQTTISFTVARQDWVRVEVFDVLGRLVATLADGAYAAGRHTVRWQARAVPSGVYLYRLQTGGRTEVKKMLLMRR